ncbi:MAG: ABC transporter permease [Ilumatobacteraceae bacterium]
MRYVGRKLIQLVIVLIAVTFTVSVALNAIPNAKERVIAARGMGATNEAEKQALLDSLHLNDSIPVQYMNFLKDFATGNWGVTLNGNEPISSAIWGGLQISLRLMIYAQFVALLLAIPTALLAAYRQGGAFDRFTTTTSFGFLATPNYILAPVFILLFSIRFRWFPTLSKNTGFFGDPVQHFKDYFLPTLCIALPLGATYLRLLRSDLIGTLQSDFITTARAKGMSTSRILFVHALRPSLFSLVTAAAVNVGALVGGSLVVETAFSLNGLGRKTVVGIFSAEFRLVQITVVVLASIYVIVNFLVDISYAWIDPRVRHARTLS